MKQRIRIILISILSLGTFIVISSFILLNLREINDGANNDTKCLKQESTSQPLTSPVDFPGFYSNIASNQNPVVDEFATLLSNVVVIHDADTTEPRMIACNPPFMVMGLYDPNVPLSPNTAIFADPLVKAEIMSDGFQGKDKEFGDIDNDGLIDILYTKNDNELWYISNTGTLTSPDYQVVNAVQTLFTNVFSFRLVDFFNDGVLDLLLLEDHGIKQINLYSNIHTQLSAPSSIGLIDDTQFPLRFDQLIEAGDVDGDGDLDVLVSGQDQGLEGTAFLEQVQGPPPLFLPFLQLGAGQTLPSNPMIPDNGDSAHAPELYDADCDGDMDLFISDPLLLTAGGHVDYYENTGSGSPFLYFTLQNANPYGLVDIPGNDLRCDIGILRFVDFFGDGCLEAIAYNPCNFTNDPNGEIFYYKNNCSCEASFEYAIVDSCNTVQFYNYSVGPQPSTYTWFFDDSPSGSNNFSLLQNPVHQFTSCGTYNVCVTIAGPGCGNTICHQVQINDFVPPVAMCKNNVMIPMDANCMATLTPLDIDGGSFDDCHLQLLAVTPNSFTACGIYPVALTVTDWCGNTGMCNTIISVVDNIPPDIVCPAGITLSSDSKNCSTIVNGIRWLSFSDNCGVSSIIYSVNGASTYSGIGDASGLAFNSGLSVVTYTAFDICGNSSSCSFDVMLSFSCDCSQNLLLNPGFSIGAIPGILGGNGQSSNWKLHWGNGRVYSSDFCCDPISLDLWGNPAQGTAVYQEGVSFLAGHHYKISFCARWKSSSTANRALKFGFNAANAPVIPPFYLYTCSNCPNMGNSNTITSTCWENQTLPIWSPLQNYNVFFIRPFSTGPGQHYGYIDNVCVEEIFYSCCADQEAFNENADLVVNILVNQSEEEVVFETGNLLECNRIVYIDWGDGTEVIQGPIDPNSSLAHVYPDTNVYEIQYLVQEFNTKDTSQVCFEKIFSTSVQIQPDSCFCNAFSSLLIRSSSGAMSMPLTCQGQATLISCPPVGSGFTFTGVFECSGTTCLDTSTISWRLSGPQENQVGIASTSPYFSIDFLPTYFSIAGVYTLTLSGFCGNEVCDCEIQFMVECEDLCPCANEDVETFEAAVNRGFTKTIFNNSCNICFTPNALSDCETATWFLNDTTGSPLGYTYGNETFCYTFPDPDEYSIIMQVDREEDVLLACRTFSYEEVISVNCFIEESCNDDLILNSSFNEGAIAGNMSTDGSTDQWTAIAGSPILLNGSAGSSDGWTIQLTGNLSVADVLATIDPICFPKGRGKVTGKNKVEHWGDPHENLNGKHLKDWKGKLFLYQGNEFELGNCPANSCYEIASIDLSQVDTGWFDFQVEYDLDLWTTALTCIVPGMAAEGIEARLAIFVTSPYTPEQGEPASRARMQIDHLCFSDFVVSTPVDEKLMPLRIYPNPNQSELVVELPEPVLQFTTLRIISLTGDVLNEISVSSSTGVQFINTEYLTTGMYFLQLISNGQVKSISKFVKI